jgi:hypothetical protein
LDVGEVVEVQPRDGICFEIFVSAGGRDVGHIGVLGLESPADECREPAGFVLQLAQPLEVFDPLGERFDVAEHHGCRATAAQLVPDAVYVQPIVGHHFSARDSAADPIDQDLRTSAG